MGLFTGVVILVLLAGWFTHSWLLDRPVPQRQAVPMEADIYRVGEAFIARRRSQNPVSSVVVMHGFLENPLYFTRYYQDPSIELIMLTSAGYHLPLQTPVFQQPPWKATPALATGTIVGDAQVLNLALEHLVTTNTVRVHGHSRGGAVVLEAARQRPELFEPVEVILEAPVLPQGQLYQPTSKIVHWLMPLVHLLWQHKPAGILRSPIWGPLDDSFKRELILAMPFNPRRSRVLMTNTRDIADWMTNTGPDIYRHVRRGAVLVPGRDRVLQSEAMLDSARQAENLQIIEVPDGSHFVLLDNPEAIPPLIRN
ncbi:MULTISPECIES: alpha/beta hydrolase [Halopseudomonas]|uniref:Pimeloyl-ACP methyl ester carboxylesterase n=1 Tax=Halopseudomonas bauzanensis TaxID=653930 RepID=A0A1I4LTJ1_9GAMM|nr:MULTISPECIES: alpha/beta hydrolase [Halopseudomonas]WGK61657.1 alpha/beta hydrolase [Halopseudomonas sp. SMJS2]SER86601.1 Pimeloyl-ACP methyl ester carboxylesterase [Halopseudomonas bauzanensis]SFL94146.1 Pimeloyl-ACP methyl ester carboxylesterase [Halopseudomonas bauzanensis]